MAAFIRLNLINWLRVNRNINFEPGANFFTNGILDPEAIFYLRGDVSNIKFSHMALFVDESASVDKFIPLGFALTPGENSNQRFYESYPMNKTYLSVPHDITFEDISLDGSYFGWHGSGQNIKIKNINSFRYSDLQSANGESVGGFGVWFPPPHLFYFNNDNRLDRALDNESFLIESIIDKGVRVGLPRDKGGNNQISGHAVSLKLQGNNSVINNYTSLRPDGFLDILSSSNLIVKNVIATYDSSFINYTLPAIRFTQQDNHNVRLENISLVDNAFFTYIDPVWGCDGTDNTDIVFVNVKFTINNWGELNVPMYNPNIIGTKPYFGGSNNFFDIITLYNNDMSHGDIAVFNNQESYPYKNNGLRNIKVGYFGLRYSRIQNNTSKSIHNISIYNKHVLPEDIKYDDTRSTCLLDLNPGQSCNIVLKYEPKTKGVNKYFIMQISAYTENYESIVMSNNVYVPFSSLY